MESYDGAVLIAAVVLIVLSVVLGAVASAALAGRLPRNGWVGVRTAESLASDQNFVVANKVAAPMILVGALTWLLGGLAALRLDGVGGAVIVALAAIAGVVLVIMGASAGTRVAEDLPTDIGVCGESCGSCSIADTCDHAVH